MSHTSVPLLLGDKNNLVARDKSLKAVVEWGPDDDRRRKKAIQSLKDNFLNHLKFAHVAFYALTRQQLRAEDDSFEVETGKNRWEYVNYVHVLYVIHNGHASGCDVTRIENAGASMLTRARFRMR